MIKSRKIKSILSIVLTLCMLLSFVPTAFAAQSNEYVDPADNWLPTNERTNEFDMNATVTNETMLCLVCEKHTTMINYRVPEYTKSGESAITRGVAYSDGMNLDGTEKGNIDSGTPGVDAYYTGYHYTKSVCQTCGTINSVEGPLAYNFNKNIYKLNPCDSNFYIDFDATTYEPYDEEEHLVSLKKGQYCQFCKGTFARAKESYDEHSFEEVVDGQISNNRFFISETCTDCGFTANEYVTAKSVISAYYGVEDGEAHTIEVTDLSDSGVRTSIRYGTAADSCTKTSAPNYTSAGYYTVYYQITYSYAGESMTENGASYVWLLTEDSDEGGDTIIIVPPENHEHSYTYIESVSPNCESLGYDRFQCTGCGLLEKRNYTPAKGHTYGDITVRDASCTQGGLIISLCSDCGDFYQTTTPMGKHDYKTEKHNPTCISVGYTDHICEECGDNYITDITPLISHAYERIVKEPTCTDKGYTTSNCTMCNLTYVSDYTDPTGHEWDEGHSVTSSTCVSEGVIEFNCVNCDEKLIKAIDATGHTPGLEATCTTPQICEVCETVLEIPLGHNYEAEITDATCTSMGYTTYTCVDCGDSFMADYTEVIDHCYDEVVTDPTCTSHGYTTYTCVDCDDSYVSDYTEKLEHNYEEMITAPTCTEMGYSTFTCVDCGDSYVGNYTDVTEHNYNKQVVEPTCTEHGYAVYTCPDCGKSYMSDYTDCKEHEYKETVVAPTCEEMGYTIFKCSDCGDEYIGNYTDMIPHDYSAFKILPTCQKLGYWEHTCRMCGHYYISSYLDKIPHDYVSEVTKPTCMDMGYTTCICRKCNDTYKGDYVDKLDHEYDVTIIEPTCTSMGFWIYDCKTCSHSYENYYRDKLPHNYRKSVTNPTCFSMGYTTYTCVNCKDTYKSDYKTPVAHGYTKTTVQPTCTEHGYTIYDCPDCDASYVSDYKDALGHSPSPWVIDVPATIEHSGRKHIECMACGVVLQETVLAQLIDKDNSDEDGRAQVGDYSIILTDENGKPIFNSELTIDVDDNVSITLTNGRLLDYAKPTTITAFYTISQRPMEGLKIFIVDAMGNMATGATDVYGQLIVPNNQSNTGNDNGTIGSDTDDTKNTFVVTVTDKTNVVIPDCEIYIGESNNIVVDLPEGTRPTRENPVIITVTDHNGNPQEGFTVIALGDSDFIEKGITDIYGKVTLPTASDGFTDEDGKVNVDELNVIVNDETGVIPDAYVLHNEDGAIVVTLPEGKSISYSNRVTVTVLDSMGTPVGEKSVTVKDTLESEYTGTTNEEGQVVVPPVTEDITDENGNAVVGGYNVVVNDETKPVENAFVELIDGKIVVTLPDGNVIDITNRIIVTVTDGENEPVKGVIVTVSDKEKSETNLTDEQGKATVPHTNIDYTDVNGYAEVNGFAVTVKRETGVVENAYVELDEENNIKITLPEGVAIAHSDRITVTVTNKAYNTPVKEISVTVKENTTEKILAGITDENGVVIFPPLSEDITDEDGKSDVTDKNEQEGSDTDGDGNVDTPGEVVETKYNVTVEDTKAIISDALIKIEGGKIFVTLPETHKLTTSNQTTVTVTDEEGKAVKGVSVTVTDSTDKTVTKTTNAKGQITVPVKSSGGGGGGSSRGTSVSTVKTTEHNAYIVGYPDGEFKPDGNMTRAEAAAIFARLVSEGKDEKIKGNASFDDVGSDAWYASYVGYLEKYDIIKGYEDDTFRPDNSVTRAEFVTMTVRFYDLFNNVKTVSNTKKYSDVSSKHWAIQLISFATEEKWLNGYADGTFKPDIFITRAEVVTVVNRATGRVADSSYINKNLEVLNKFTDLKNNSYWAFYDIMEAANDHKAVASTAGETWSK